MAKTLTDLFKVNDKSLFAPDADVAVSYSDLDGDDTGRDEAGYMHRIVVRYKVGTWSFEYASITEEELAYMESLFGETPDFDFTRPDRLNSGGMVVTKAYRSNYGIAWHDARRGMWRNYKFNIIEC